MEATEINTFVERLNQKLEHVEWEVADMRRQLKQLEESTEISISRVTSEAKEISLLERARRNKEKQQQAFAKLFERMGIHGEPIGAEKVQEMIAACGIKPEDNEFSRGIIAMREE